jgi:hypothetical protein
MKKPFMDIGAWEPAREQTHKVYDLMLPTRHCRFQPIRKVNEMQLTLNREPLNL